MVELVCVIAALVKQGREDQKLKDILCYIADWRLALLEMKGRKEGGKERRKEAKKEERKEIKRGKSIDVNCNHKHFIS